MHVIQGKLSMRSLGLVLFYIIVRVEAFDTIDIGKYERNICMSNKIPPGVTPVFVRALTDCASACNIDPDCTGIYYSDVNKTCVLTSSAYTVFDEDIDVTFYIKSSSIVQITTTAVSESDCPSTFIEDVALTGRHGSTYTLKFSQQEKGVPDAELECECLGMKLLKVTSVEKMEDIVGFIRSCDAYQGYDYWTDAKRQVTGPGSGPWKNSDGDVIPYGAWCGNNPGIDANEDCARLNEGCSYKLADRSCDHPFRFICE